MWKRKRSLIRITTCQHKPRTKISEKFRQKTDAKKTAKMRVEKLRFQRRILIAIAYLFPRNSHGLTRRTRAKIRGLEKIRGSEKRLSWGEEISPLKFIKFVMLSSLYVFFLVTQNGKAFVSKHSDLGFGTGGWTNELIFAHHRWNSYGQKKVGDDLVTS